MEIEKNKLIQDEMEDLNKKLLEKLLELASAKIDLIYLENEIKSLKDELTSRGIFYTSMLAGGSIMPDISGILMMLSSIFGTELMLKLIDKNIYGLDKTSIIDCINEYKDYKEKINKVSKLIDDKNKEYVKLEIERNLCTDEFIKINKEEEDYTRTRHQY